MEGKANFIKGINYGYYSFDNGKLVCQKDNKVMLTVPADKITNSTVVNKQDIAMELMTDDPTEYVEREHLIYIYYLNIIFPPHSHFLSSFLFPNI
jgi:hypothetical protein